MFDFHRRVMRVFGGNRVIVMDTEGCERAFRHDFAPEAVVAPIDGVGAVVFEGAVLHEVGVEAAVAGVADVFEEDAPQVGADGAHARFVECGGEFVGHGVAVSRIFVSRGDGNGGWDRHRTSLSFGAAMTQRWRKAGRRHANHICIVTYSSANPSVCNGHNTSVSLCICNDFTESKKYNIVTYQS